MKKYTRGVLLTGRFFWTKSLMYSCILILLSSCGSINDSQLEGDATNENWILNGEKSVTYEDDYGSHYTITATNWIQDSQNTYNIILWNFDDNYLLAQNDTSNIDEKGLYTRIDFMKFEGMELYTWGYCLTEYAAELIDGLLLLTSPDREHPKTGCNGFPFSRMMRVY